jgi:uridine phosphorylase
MVYPQYQNKHLEEALVLPESFIKYKKINTKGLPKDYIFIYHKRPLRNFIRRYKGRYKIIKITGHLTIYQYKNIGIVLMQGVGAPHAVMIFEELIAMGGKRFLNIGLAGGLQNEGYFICNKAIRDEGTSHHYLPHRRFVYPDKSLTKKLEETLKNNKIIFSVAPTWTIDTPYRETKAEVIHYRKEGIATVEMETSALFAVAQVREVKIASAFIVSDMLTDKWEQKFHNKNVKKGLNKLFYAAIDCLIK